MDIEGKLIYNWPRPDIMVGPGDGLLSLANKHVHLSENLFSMYQVSQEPRLLVRALEHCHRAIENAFEAVLKKTGEIGGIERFSQMVEEEIKVDGAKEAIQLYTDISYLLEEYQKSPTVFNRKGRFVIANDEYDSLTEVSDKTVFRAMNIVKRFVYEAGKSTVMGLVTR